MFAKKSDIFVVAFVLHSSFDQIPVMWKDEIRVFCA